VLDHECLPEDQGLQWTYSNAKINPFIPSLKLTAVCS